MFAAGFLESSGIKSRGNDNLFDLLVDVGSRDVVVSEHAKEVLIQYSHLTYALIHAHPCERLSFWFFYISHCFVDLCSKGRPCVRVGMDSTAF